MNFRVALFLAAGARSSSAFAFTARSSAPALVSPRSRPLGVAAVQTVQGGECRLSLVYGSMAFTYVLQLCRRVSYAPANITSILMSLTHILLIITSLLKPDLLI